MYVLSRHSFQVRYHIPGGSNKSREESQAFSLYMGHSYKQFDTSCVEDLST